MTESVRSIPFATMVNLAHQNITLGRSKFLGRLKVTLGTGDNSKTVYGSDLIKNTLMRLSNEQERGGAFVVLQTLKNMSNPKPMTLIARICLKISRIFSSGSLAELHRNLVVRSMEIGMAIAFIRENPERFANLPERIRNTRAVVLEAVRQDGFALEYVSEALRNDLEVVLTAVRQDGNSLQDASAELQNNRDVVLAAIRQNGFAYEYVGEALRNDPEIFAVAVHQDSAVPRYFTGQINFFSLMEGAVGLLRANPDGVDRIALEALCQNHDVVVAAVRQNGLALQYASETLRSSPAVVSVAVKENGLALQYATEALRNFRNLVMIAVRQNGLALQYASPGLQSDPEIRAAAGL